MPGRGRGRGAGRGVGRRWLELFILLLIAEKPSHGYELSGRLEEFGVQLPGIGQMGSLYRILSSLEEMSLLSTDWDTTEGGPAKKIYKITDAGLKYLDDASGNIIEMKKNLEKFLERHTNLKNKR